MAIRITQGDLDKLTGDHLQWAYNAMDASVTAELEKTLQAQLDEDTGKVYRFERDLLAPSMEMSLRGIRVDMLQRSRMISKLESDGKKLSSLLSQYGAALGLPPINPNSKKQLETIFYDLLALPKQKRYDRKAKEERVTVNREALEKLSKYPLANPLVMAILAQRDTLKKLTVLRTGVDADNRMRCSFNVAGTETGRWSSSKNVFRGGMNAQNITEELRQIFIASPGKKLGYIDLEQAESRAVAALSQDQAYIQACNSGDLHTTVSRLIWPERPWTGNLAADKQLANEPFYRQFSYRDMAKRGGHGTNYLGTPRTMAIHLKVEIALMEAFQGKYFRAFPGIRAWHEDTALRLQTTGKLTTPFGRRRNFLGRLGDAATLREAVAYVPQSLIGDYMNTGILNVWRWGRVDILAQVHDALLFEYPEDQDELAFEVAKILSADMILKDGSTFHIPTDVAVGWNWAKQTEANPFGLAKIKPGKPDTRKPNSHGTSPFELLDRRLS